jgi:hypothetical protein
MRQPQVYEHLSCRCNMLDVLAFAIDRPLFLSLHERRRSLDRHERQDVRRIVTHQEIEDAFKEVRFLEKSSSSALRGNTNPSVLRSLGWYRKGLYTEDPFDRFLAFWNSIEIVAARYCRDLQGIDQARARKGIKNQVWACFTELWGPCKGWPVIPANDKWIDESYEIRNDIAHGAGSVDIERVASVASRNDEIQQVAHRFLQDWREKLPYVDHQLSPERASVTGAGSALPVASEQNQSLQQTGHVNTPPPDSTRAPE